MAVESKTGDMKRFLGLLSGYKKEFEKWETRTGKILKRYRDDERTTDRGEGEVRFNILWSNVQTLVPATFSRIPKADVSRRYRDSDPVGRVASLILERGLEYEITHYADFRATMKAAVYDRFLGGRGCAWARYEPHIKAAKEQLPQDGLEITEDVDPPDEELDYECAPADYVHWKDFGHAVARTWEEVPIVWRRVYMTMPAKEERFPDQADKIPKDAKPSDDRYPKQRTGDGDDGDEGSWIYELWDKDRKKVYWFHKAMKEVLDERDDPLGLADFFPCPRPLYATLTNDSLVPVPDFSLYQDQARSLDTLADRIHGLVNMLQVKGVYDASADKAIGRLFTEGGNGNLIPVKNWAAFAEKNGLKGTVDIVDLDPISRALKEAYAAFAQIIQFVYQITGIADIVRGVTDPNETLGAQEIKKNFVGLRLGDMKMEVAQFATGLLQLKAQIMCAKFAPQTLLTIAAADQLSPEDQQVIMPAMALLVGPERMADPDAEEGPNPMRSFRIEVNADSLIQIDDATEQENRTRLMTAFGTYLEKGGMLIAQAPQSAPLVIEVGKFVLSSFKVGKNIEGTFDALLEQLKAQAANPQATPPDPEMVKVEQEGKLKAGQMQMDAKMKQNEHSDKMALEFRKHQDSMQLEKDKMLAEQQREQVRLQQEGEQMHMQAGMDMKKHDDTMGMEKMRLRADTLQKGIKGINPESLEVMAPDEDPEVQLMKQLVAGTQETNQMLAAAIQGLTAVVQQLETTVQASMLPRESQIVRDPSTGRAERAISRVVTQ